jgi:parallel beta-helix repeat protein
MAIYYVSANSGNDSSTGSQSSPFKTLDRAAYQVKAGDTVLVMNGTYKASSPGNNVLTISKSGTPGNPITFKAAPGHKPVIRATGWKGINVYDAGYVNIEGFEIIGNRNETTYEEAWADRNNPNNPKLSNHGIEIFKAHHINIRNNHIHDMNGNGIGAVRSDYVTIENNIVHHNAFYSSWGNSGITTYQPWNYDNNTSSPKIIIRGNTIYANENKIPFRWAGKITDGNGIILDDHRGTQGGSINGAYRGQTLIEDNVVYENGGRGIHSFYSDNAVMRDNTIVNNLQTKFLQDGYNGNLNLQQANNVKASRNIVSVTNGTKGISVHDANGSSTSGNFLGDPKFVNPANDDYRLKQGSPAAGYGADFGGASPNPSPAPTENPADIPLRINAGGDSFTDLAGNVWQADKYATNGEVHSTDKAIADTGNDGLYQTERWGQDLSYAIPVKNGTYDIKLHHAEIFFGEGTGQRVFDTKVEGKLISDDLDLGQTGSHTAYVQTIKGVEVKDGKLNIDLSATANNAQLAGIEVLKASGSDSLAPIVVEAESMKTKTYRVHTTLAASGRKVLGLRGGEKGETGMASFDFTGKSGKYDVVVGYFDETDGVGQMKVQHEQKVLDVWELDSQLGSAVPDAKSKASRMVARGLSIEQGDTFTLTGMESGGEFARIDYIAFKETMAS